MICEFELFELFISLLNSWGYLKSSVLALAKLYSIRCTIYYALVTRSSISETLGFFPLALLLLFPPIVIIGEGWRCCWSWLTAVTCGWVCFLGMVLRVLGRHFICILRVWIVVQGGKSCIAVLTILRIFQIIWCWLPELARTAPWLLFILVELSYGFK